MNDGALAGEAGAVRNVPVAAAEALIPELVRIVVPAAGAADPMFGPGLEERMRKVMNAAASAALSARKRDNKFRSRIR